MELNELLDYEDKLIKIHMDVGESIRLPRPRVMLQYTLMSEEYEPKGADIAYHKARIDYLNEKMQSWLEIEIKKYNEQQRILQVSKT